MNGRTLCMFDKNLVQITKLYSPHHSSPSPLPFPPMLLICFYFYFIISRLVFPFNSCKPFLLRLPYPSTFNMLGKHVNDCIAQARYFEWRASSDGLFFYSILYFLLTFIVHFFPVSRSLLNTKKKKHDEEWFGSRTTIPSDGWMMVDGV